MKASASDPIKLALVGDSTVCDYSEDSPLRGWGQVLPEFLASSVVVSNCARGGASTRTFLANGWQHALGGKPDYVFIQFGHNDSHGKGQPESTDADTGYTDNLRCMVRAARRSGAVPVLVTPMHRRCFDAEGRATRELLPYTVAMKRVAAAEKVPLIDLHTLSGCLIEKMGESGASALHVAGDRTHFNREGAGIMARLVAGSGRKMPELKVLFAGAPLKHKSKTERGVPCVKAACGGKKGCDHD